MSFLLQWKAGIRKHWQFYIVALITLVLFLIPNLFWGNLYVVGGDDARLYYLFPREYLENYSFNLISGNTLGGNLGYIAESYSVPIIAIILTLKTLLPHINTQLFMSGLIFSLGFIFFHLFLQELVSKKTSYHFWSSVVASIFYILSFYVTHTYFREQYPAIFLLMVLPGCLYFFVSGVKRKSGVRVIVSSLLYTIFSSTVLSLPWLLPVIVTLIPFFIYLMFRYGKYFWKMIALFFGFTFICNFYWIIHYIIPVIAKTGETNFTASLLTEAFKQQNSDLIAALANLNSPVNQMINFLRTSWQDRQGATVIQAIGAVYLAIILFAGVMLGRAKKNIRILYLIASAGLLLAMLFITPNFGQWNVRLFQFLNDHVPFFVIFRNMYDKFALAMAFNYSFALYISFVVLAEAKVNKIFRYLCIGIVFFVTLVFAIPYIHLARQDSRFSTRISGQLNKDYKGLTKYIKSLGTTSRFVWFPMTFPGYVYISDEANPGHFYMGISPLQIFSRSSDLAGFYGIQTASEPDLNWQILDLLKNKQYEKVGNIFKRQNVGYVIVNHEQLPAEGLQMLEGFDFMKYQGEEYKNTILGDKIRDFGNRYSLYAIHRNFAVPTVFLTDGGNGNGVSDDNVAFHRTQDGAYDIGPFEVTAAARLVLMEPYNRLWKLERLDGYKHQTIQGAGNPIYGYGNTWVLDPAVLGSPTLHVRVEFWPNKYIVPSVIVSGLGLCGAVFYILVSVIRSRTKKAKRI